MRHRQTDRQTDRQRKYIIDIYIYIYIYILAENPPFGRDFQLVPAESYVLASLRSASIYYIYRHSLTNLKNRPCHNIDCIEASSVPVISIPWSTLNINHTKKLTIITDDWPYIIDWSIFVLLILGNRSLWAKEITFESP